MYKFEQIISDIKKKVYFPIYFLMGEEPYYIDYIADCIEENILSESEKEFNFTLLYGKDIDGVSLLSYAKRYPMMSNYQVVIVREAQDLKNIDALELYCKDPLKTTILVFCYKYKTLDKRKALTKAIDKHAVLFESPKMYDNQLESWIKKYVDENSIKITDKAIAMLAEHIGMDLKRLTNEIDKLIINVGKDEIITEVHIEEQIGISKDFNVFELQKALGNKDAYKVFMIADHFGKNQKDNPLVMVISLLYSYFSKIMIYHQVKSKSNNEIASAMSINPFFVKDYSKAAQNYPYNKVMTIMKYLLESDLKSKGVETGDNNPHDIMKELFFKILN